MLGRLASQRDGRAFFAVPLDGSELTEDAIVEYVAKNRHPQIVESFVGAGDKWEAVGTDGPEVWWLGFDLGYELPPTATIRVAFDDSLEGRRLSNISIETQDPEIFTNTPTAIPGPDERRPQQMNNAFDRIDQIKKRDPNRRITDKDWNVAKYQSEAEDLIDKYSDNDAYWSMRRTHDERVQKRIQKASAAPLTSYQTRQQAVDDLRDRTLGGPSVYDMLGTAIDVRAELLEDDYPEESHSQRVGRVLDDSRVATAYSYATTVGRTQPWDEFEGSVAKSFSGSNTAADETYQTILWLADDEV